MTELEAKTVNGFDRRDVSYYVRLGSLSTKLRKRAYTRAVAKIQDGKQRSMGFISGLNSTVDMVGPLELTIWKLLFIRCLWSLERWINCVCFSRLNTAESILAGRIRLYMTSSTLWWRGSPTVQPRSTVMTQRWGGHLACSPVHKIKDNATVPNIKCLLSRTKQSPTPQMCSIWITNIDHRVQIEQIWYRSSKSPAWKNDLCS